MADGLLLKVVNRETRLLPVAILTYYEKITFDIVEIVIYTVILNMFWLKKHNLIIDWKKEIFKKKRFGRVIKIYFIYQQRIIVNKDLSRKPAEIKTILFLNKNDFNKKSGSTRIVYG